MGQQEWSDFECLPPADQQLTIDGLKVQDWYRSPSTFARVMAIVGVLGTIAGVVTGVAGAASAINALKAL